MNPFWAQFAQQVREANPDTPPNRKQIRDMLRHNAPPALRRCVFGLWRRSPEWVLT